MYDYRPIERAANRSLPSCGYQTKQTQTRSEMLKMNILRKIGVLLLVLGVVAGFTQAAEKKQKPDATLKLSGGSVAAGIGWSWGSGTLTYKGKEYSVKVTGLSLGKVGITGASAVGEVYNLKNLADFDGHYNAGGVGATLAGGQSAIAMTNQNDVKVLLEAQTRGIDLTIAGGGVTMKIKR
jgi:hypothetical protein